jgi:hypothetical protein
VVSSSKILQLAVGELLGKIADFGLLLLHLLMKQIHRGIIDLANTQV